MLTGSQVFLLLSVFLPPAVLLFLLRRLRSENSRLKSVLLNSQRSLLSAGEALEKQFRKQPEQQSLLPEFPDPNQIDIRNLSEDSNLIYVESNRDGLILRMNSFTRKTLGYSELENPSLHIREFTSFRQQSILQLGAGMKNPEKAGKTIPFSLTNRYGERLQMLLNVFPFSREPGFLVLGHLISSLPGFGPERYLPVFESLLFQSKWPSVLLEKSPKLKGIRKSRLIWASVSAEKLMGIESHRAGGMPLEAISQSLASLLYRMNTFGEAIPLWQPNPDAPENAYRILVNSEDTFTLLQILPAAFFPELQTSDNDIKVSSNVNVSHEVDFSRLLEITKGDPAFLKDLLPSYLSTLRECRSQFRRALDEGNEEKIRFLHHKIKATIRTFELGELEEIFQQAMKQVKTHNQADETESTLLMARLNSVCSDSEKAILDFARQNNLHF